MRKSPRAFRAAVLAAGALLGLTGLVGVATPASADATCVPAARATYEHTFNGPAGTASIALKNGRTLCDGEQSFALVAYTAPSATFQFPQYVLQSDVRKFTPGAEGRLDFAVEVPECFTQVDFVFGDRVIDPLVSDKDLYGDRKVGSDRGEGSRSTPAAGSRKHAWYNGGAGSCKAEPVVEALPDCDGNVVLTLINRSTYSAPFAITADGGFTESRTLAVRAEPVTVKVPAAHAKNIVVTSRGTELWKGEWAHPADCPEEEPATPVSPSASPSVSTPPAGSSPSASPSASPSVPVSTSPSGTPTVAPSAGVPAASPSTSAPAATPPAAATTTPSATPVATTPAGDDEELALTGAAAGSIAGGAVLLLLLGAGLFFLARRRKVDFKA